MVCFAGLLRSARNDRDCHREERCVVAIQSNSIRHRRALEELHSVLPGFVTAQRVKMLARMKTITQARRYLPALFAVIFAGCVTDDVDLRVESLEAQVSTLEQRIEDMEAAQDAAKKPQDHTVETPQCVKREALQGRIADLLNRRGTLLIKYTEKHPDIVELDRQIRLARDQVNTLDQSCDKTPSMQEQ